MSIAFESYGDTRPVDLSADDGDEIAIDGKRLKQLRIERGLSIPEAARLATLSREQVDQIENGGLVAFYGARHKVLAVRKYAQCFGLSMDELVLPVVAEAAIIAPAPMPLTQMAADEELPAPSRLSEISFRRLPLAIVIGVALVLVFSTLRGLMPAPAEFPPPAPVAELASPVNADVPSAPSAVAEASPVMASPAGEPLASDACALSAGPDTPRWAPAQARNASTRVFLSSAAPVDVCVTDATGTSTPLTLKPGAMTSAAGKPPYIVRSERLSQVQIFLQGLKVRVPASAMAVHLITTASVRSPEPAPASEREQ